MNTTTEAPEQERVFSSRTDGYPSIRVPVRHRMENERSWPGVFGLRNCCADVVIVCRETGEKDANGREIFAQGDIKFVWNFQPAAGNSGYGWREEHAIEAPAAV